MIKKGIVLSGGSASRLAPASFGISKQLLPIYDKPMIYYPISLLMQSNIREILIITNPHDLDNFKRLFSFFEDGALLGISIQYVLQEEPRGIADTFILGRDFIQKENIALVLGDNILYGYGLEKHLKESIRLDSGAIIFGSFVSNPSSYGVVEFDKDKKILSLEEKPIKPKSNYAIPGIYFYDNNVVDYAYNLKPSLRNELEITDINKIYLQNNKLKVIPLGKEIDWFDIGTHENMLLASSYIESIQKRKGILIGSLEEIAFQNGWIDVNKIEKLIALQSKTDYGKYLQKLIELYV